MESVPIIKILLLSLKPPFYILPCDAGAGILQTSAGFLLGFAIKGH